MTSAAASACRTNSASSSWPPTTRKSPRSRRCSSRQRERCRGSRNGRPRFLRGRASRTSPRVAALWSPSTGSVEPEALVQRAAAPCAPSRDALSCLRRRWSGARRGSGTRFDPGRERIRTPARRECRGALRRRGLGRTWRRGIRRSIRAAASTPSLRASRRSLGQRPRLPGATRLGHGLGVHLTRTTRRSVLLGPTAALPARKADYERSPRARGFPGTDQAAAARC